MHDNLNVVHDTLSEEYTYWIVKVGKLIALHPNSKKCVQAQSISMRLSRAFAACRKVYDEVDALYKQIEQLREEISRRTNWTEKRPKKPGAYWLSIHPSKRGRHFPSVLSCRVVQTYRSLLYVGPHDPALQSCDPSKVLVACDCGVKFDLDSNWFDGARWANQSDTPQDPFGNERV